MTAADKQRIEAFVRRGVGDTDPTPAQLIDVVDKRLLYATNNMTGDVFYQNSTIIIQLQSTTQLRFSY